MLLRPREHPEIASAISDARAPTAKRDWHGTVAKRRSRRAAEALVDRPVARPLTVPQQLQCRRGEGRARRDPAAGDRAARDPERSARAGGARGGSPLDPASRTANRASPAELPAARGRVSRGDPRPAAVHAASARDRAADRGSRGALCRRLARAGRGRRRRRRSHFAPARGGSRRLVVRRGQRPDRAPQPLVPDRGPAAMDPKTGDYALVNGRDYRLDPLDADVGARALPAGLRCRRATSLARTYGVPPSRCQPREWRRDSRRARRHHRRARGAGPGGAASRPLRDSGVSARRPPARAERARAAGADPALGGDRLRRRARHRLPPLLPRPRVQPLARHANRSPCRPGGSGRPRRQLRARPPRRRGRLRRSASPRSSSQRASTCPRARSP